MAAPTTIIEYATARRDEAQQRLTKSQEELVAAQTALANASNDLAAKTALLVSLNNATADIRKKLAVVPTPADGEALLAELEQLTIRQRATESAVAGAQAGVLVARGNIATAQSMLARVSADLTTAQTDLTSATTANIQRAQWKAALGAEPFASLHNKATNAFNPALAEGEPFTKAKERIEADIPAKLLTRAEERRAAEDARLMAVADNTQAAADAVIHERKNNGGLATIAADLLGKYRAIESATGDYLTSATTRFAQAKAALSEVADKSNSQLTEEQIARINDEDLKDARETAADEEKDVADKRKELEDKQAILDDAIVAAKADPADATKAQDIIDAQGEVTTAQTAYLAARDAWIDKRGDYEAAITDVENKQQLLNEARQAAIAAGQDRETFPAVVTAKTNLTAAKQHLEDAEDDYKASNIGILDAWEAAVPDSIWRLFEQYENARETLNELKTPTAAAVRTAFETAETNYVTAQLKADASASVLSELVAEREARAAREAGARQAAPARLFGALRGDE
jgi:hypothetical protein